MQAANDTHPIRPRAMRLKDAVRYSGLSLATINRALAAGSLSRLKCGKTTLVEVADLDQWMDAMRTPKAA